MKRMPKKEPIKVTGKVIQDLSHGLYEVEPESKHRVRAHPWSFCVRGAHRAAKQASVFYGPFREAAGSAPSFGDRKSYQMDPANADEAIREMELDLEEGADILMVKPALPCLDIIREAAATFPVPIAAYNVSGEYAMVHAAATAGWLDLEGAMVESLVAIKRAGARIILTYFALDSSHLLDAVAQCGADMVGVDWRVPLDVAARRLDRPLALQGNLDPCVLMADPVVIERRALEVLHQARGLPGHVFNLGHGVLPNTPVEHVEALLRPRGVELLQVKTLGPSRPSAAYARTRGFYEHLGFRPLEENALWGEVNPCLIMVKHL